MRKVTTLAVAGAMAWGVGAAQAGDPDRGRLQANTCLGCHGIEGYRNTYPSYHAPKLGGQNEEYLISALQAYRDGIRDHATMSALARALTEEEIENIAAFFARERN